MGGYLLPGEVRPSSSHRFNFNISMPRVTITVTLFARCGKVGLTMMPEVIDTLEPRPVSYC